MYSPSLRQPKSNSPIRGISAVSFLPQLGGNKKPAIADGLTGVRFRREMDSDNHNAPCFSLAGLVLLSANRHQASRRSGSVVLLHRLFQQGIQSICRCLLIPVVALDEVTDDDADQIPGIQNGCYMDLILGVLTALD